MKQIINIKSEEKPVKFQSISIDEQGDIYLMVETSNRCIKTVHIDELKHSFDRHKNDIKKSYMLHAYNILEQAIYQEPSSACELCGTDICICDD